MKGDTLEYRRAWRAANPEKVREYSRKWRAAHPATSAQRAERAAYARKWRQESGLYGMPAQVIAQRKRSRACKLRKYGLTPEQFAQMHADQAGRCAICGDTCRCVDHDHKTGKVRGLLCGSCNRALGFLKDSADICAAAAAYLQSHATQ